MRKYNPELGRWMSREFIGELGSINIYGSNGGFPVSTYDVFGGYANLLPHPAWLLISFAAWRLIGIIPKISFPLPSLPSPAIPPTPPAIVQPIENPGNPEIGAPTSPGIIDVGTGDPDWAHNYEVFEACKLPSGKCAPCPPDSPIWRHRHRNGIVNCHQVQYHQSKATCICFPKREHIPCPD